MAHAGGPRLWRQPALVQMSVCKYSFLQAQATPMQIAGSGLRFTWLCLLASVASQVHSSCYTPGAHHGWRTAKG